MADEEKEEEKVEPQEPYVERPSKVWRRNPKFTQPVHEEEKE